MFICPGVQLIGRTDHQSGWQHVSEAMKTDARRIVCIIDTFHRLDVHSSLGLLQAITDALELPEWYGYHFEDLVVPVLCMGLEKAPHLRARLIVIVLRPDLHNLLHDRRLINALFNTHQQASTKHLSLHTMLFTHSTTALNSYL